jgi:hypothetical protein
LRPSECGGQIQSRAIINGQRGYLIQARVGKRYLRGYQLDVVTYTCPKTIARHFQFTFSQSDKQISRAHCFGTRTQACVREPHILLDLAANTGELKFCLVLSAARNLNTPTR